MGEGGGVILIIPNARIESKRPVHALIRHNVLRGRTSGCPKRKLILTALQFQVEESYQQR